MTVLKSESTDVILSNKILRFWLRSGSLCLFTATIILIITVTHYRHVNSDYRRLDSQNPNTIDISPVISNNLANVGEPLSLTDTAVFWFIPKSGTSTMHEFVSCIGLTTANQLGKLFGDKNDKELKVIKPWNDYHKVVNVDTMTIPGLQNAKSRGFAQSLLADVVFTINFHEAAGIFNPGYRGRAFALFRHPVDRAVSTFYYLQDADWEKSYAPKTKDMSMLQYAQSEYCVHNWMTFMLLTPNDYTPKDNERNLEVAKAILKEKFLVGLTSQMEESFERFDKYFDFDDGTGVTKICSSKLLTKGQGRNVHSHPSIEPGSEDWEVLAKVNEWDIKLYEYTIDLFKEQGKIFLEDM